MRTTILLFIISAAIVYGGLLLPQTLLIEKKIEIESSSSHISDYLYDLPKWEQWLDWQNWEELQGTSDTEYVYSQFPQGVGAFMKFNAKGKGVKNDIEKAELYIQSMSKENISSSETLKYIANFKTYQAHIEGELKLKSNPKNDNSSTLNFTLEIDFGENPFVRYVAYLYYKPKIEKETSISLERLKKLCENPVFCKK